MVWLSLYRGACRIDRFLLVHPPTCDVCFAVVKQVENRYHSAGRARRFFHSVSKGNDSTVPRLFAIVTEQQRKQLVDAAQR